MRLALQSIPFILAGGLWLSSLPALGQTRPAENSAPAAPMAAPVSPAASPVSPPAGPASPSPVLTPAEALSALQLRANEMFNRQDYAGALPVLQAVAQQLSDQPDQLGPVMEQIRVCKRQLKAARSAPGPVNPAAPASPAPPVTPSSSLSDGRVVHPAPKPGETVVLAIKDLGNFDYDADKGGNIPADVQALNGCHIRTTGFMIPLGAVERFTSFALVPSLFSCCFGGPPQVQHTLVVNARPGTTLTYFQDELVVEGTLHVHEMREGDLVVSIFQIDATSVRPAPQ